MNDDVMARKLIEARADAEEHAEAVERAERQYGIAAYIQRIREINERRLSNERVE